ncbi:DeoR/GlpR family DNA-binding transcription regulator [Caldibacillus lycopersici]|uniref:DeoR/GlpR family DNA-binding transcription regulator n=1 Tax=Perspicuibacillus lycopersici TaxID=1325689 RepID=A0AAE3IW81_9BACI|nr:DeoR/GlpR family DNA-binding transcription regulator [Perspicuibacillus lycopersici]MCU9615332.1 DeoR/GlpR family DNA-binding transcription regulator [Perspicuibacillus lycopersici]
MLAEERRKKILEMIQREGRVIAKDLSDLFQMSIDSIRRDLTIMEEQGLLQKTYGGAILVSPKPKVRSLPQPEAKRYGEGAPHQNAISRIAASYIQSDDTVYIGGAGIQFGMLKYLPTDIPFTVITNSIKIAESIRRKENITAYLIGGKLRKAESAGSMIDILAIEMIRKFTLDISFLTGGGLTSTGISTATPEGAAFARTVAQSSRKNICLAPHEKVGHQMFVTSVPMDSIDLVITDSAAPAAVMKEMENKQIEIIYADEIETNRSVRNEMD